MNRRQLLQKLVAGPLLSPLALLPVEGAAVAGGAVSVSGKPSMRFDPGYGADEAVYYVWVIQTDGTVKCYDHGWNIPPIN